MNTTSLIIGGMTIGFGIALLLDNMVDISGNAKQSHKQVYIQWMDTNNPPVPGFEQAVDMYYSPNRDTIYMERSYGPNKQ
jgi:hypothetical protein